MENLFWSLHTEANLTLGEYLIWLRLTALVYMTIWAAIAVITALCYRTLNAGISTLPEQDQFGCKVALNICAGCMYLLVTCMAINYFLVALQTLYAPRALLLERVLSNIPGVQL